MNKLVAKAYDELLEDGYADINQTLSLHDFEEADKLFFIPFSSYDSFPKKRPPKDKWLVKAEMKVEDRWLAIGIVCSIPTDEELAELGMEWKDIDSYVTLVDYAYKDW